MAEFRPDVLKKVQANCKRGNEVFIEPKHSIASYMLTKLNVHLTFDELRMVLIRIMLQCSQKKSAKGAIKTPKKKRINSSLSTSSAEAEVEEDFITQTVYDEIVNDDSLELPDIRQAKKRKPTVMGGRREDSEVLKHVKRFRKGGAHFDWINTCKKDYPLPLFAELASKQYDSYFRKVIRTIRIQEVRYRTLC